MDIKKAVSVQMVTPKYGFAIFTTDWENKPCEPTVHFLIKNTRKNESTWYQMTPGWYVETLLEKEPHVKNLGDENEPGLYIDYGQNWFIPAGAYSMMWDFLEEFTQTGVTYSDSEVLNGEIW